ncbi:MAG: hypothetical protein EBX72_13150, partial [Betaproteobacteria bacterium]|nr:hypothetical protein [Betaproteobacteria bacterium]
MVCSNQGLQQYRPALLRLVAKHSPTGKPVSGPLLGLKCKSACKRGQAGMLQVFSSFVAAITSRLSL